MSNRVGLNTGFIFSGFFVSSSLDLHVSLVLLIGGGNRSVQFAQALPTVYQLVFFIFIFRTKQDKGQRVFQNINEIKTKKTQRF